MFMISRAILQQSVCAQHSNVMVIKSAKELESFQVQTIRKTEEENQIRATKQIGINENK